MNPPEIIKPVNNVWIRRGNKVMQNVPTKLLIVKIKDKKLFGSDEISVGGQKWVRLDRHRQLARYFEITPPSPQTLRAPRAEEDVFADLKTISAGLEPYEEHLEKLACMLKELDR